MTTSTRFMEPVDTSVVSNSHHLRALSICLLSPRVGNLFFSFHSPLYGILGDFVGESFRVPPKTRMTRSIVVVVAIVKVVSSVHYDF